MRHTVVISDIHLSEVERTDGAWMRYRQRPYLPDREIVEVLDAVRAELHTGDAARPSDELIVVLNGDIFDFDAPHVINGESVFHDMPRDAEHTVPALAAILDDHPIFVDALGRVLAEGHEVVVVAGNHDAALTLPEVEALLTSRLTEAAARMKPRASTGDAAGQAFATRLTFRWWFHRTPDDIVIEHGNQYDRFCSLESPIIPASAYPCEIPPTMGTLATRHLASRFGYFNLHDDRSFTLSAWGYAAHWARHYLFSRRSPLLIWAIGMHHILAAVRRRRLDPLGRAAIRRLRREALLACAAQTGASLRAVARHARLFARPVEGRLRVVLRELWLDRVALLSFAILISILGLVLLPGAAALGGMVFLAAVVAYTRLASWSEPHDTHLEAGHVARRIAEIHRARAVVFGHTHRAFGRWEGALFLGNSGSWAALPPSEHAPFTERLLIWLKSDPARPGESLFGGLYAFREGRLLPRKVRPLEQGHARS